MPLSDANFDQAAEAEWQFISNVWWRAPFDFTTWTYHQNRPDSKQPYAKPPHYHDSLVRRLVSADEQTTSWSMPLSQSEDIVSCEEHALNCDLVGVRGAESAMIPYEIAVGISSPSDSVSELQEEAQGDIKKVDKEYIAATRQHWNLMVEDLVGRSFDVHSDRTLDSCSAGSNSSVSSTSSGTRRTASSFSSFGSVDSERSRDFFSMPSTPKNKASYANIVVKNMSPSNCASGLENPMIPSSGKTLNAYASSFVPSFMSPTNSIDFPSLGETKSTSMPTHESTSSPTSLSTFVFPRLADSPTKSKNDDSSFFNDTQIAFPTDIVPTNRRSISSDRVSSTLLPPFLQQSSARRKVRISRTREIVDRLRLQSLTNQCDIPSTFAPNSTFTEDEKASNTKDACGASFTGQGISGSQVESEVSIMSTQVDDEGWINVMEPPVTQDTKTKRTRELFLALTRRRTDSLSSDGLKDQLKMDESGSMTPDIHSESPVPSRSLTPFNEGWVSSPSPPMSKKEVPTSFTNKNRLPASITFKRSSTPGSRRRSTSGTSASQHSHHVRLNSTSYVNPQNLLYSYGPFGAVAMPMPFAAAAYIQNQYQLGIAGTVGHLPLFPMFPGTSFTPPTVLPLRGHSTTPSMNMNAAAYAGRNVSLC